MIAKLTALLLVGSVLDLALNRAPAAWRHMLWRLTLGAALVLPISTAFVPRLVGNVFSIQSSSTAGAVLASSAVRFNWLLTVYVVGAALLAIRLIFDVIETNRIARNAKPSGIPGLKISSEAVVPFAWREIVVPVGYETRAAVIAHEAAHLERGDVWAFLAARLVCVFYWFHPLAWWGASRLRLEADRACDDTVLRRGFDDATYAEDLLAVAVGLSGQRFAPAAIRDGELKKRVSHVLDSQVNRRALGRTGSLLALLAAALVLIPVSGLSQENGNPIRIGPGVTAPRVLQKVDPDYTKEAKDAKLEGAVLLSIVVGTDGVARDVKVIRGLGSGLDEQAVAAVGRWVFQPAMKDGSAVAVFANIEINFHLL